MYVNVYKDRLNKKQKKKYMKKITINIEWRLKKQFGYFIDQINKLAVIFGSRTNHRIIIDDRWYQG